MQASSSCRRREVDGGADLLFLEKSCSGDNHGQQPRICVRALEDEGESSCIRALEDKGERRVERMICGSHMG